MPRYEMTDVIASREYILQKDGQTELICVEIGRPTPQPETPHRWVCPWIIRRPGVAHQSAGLGADSLDALTTALSALRIVLEQIASTGTLTVGDVEGPSIELLGGS